MKISIGLIFLFSFQLTWAQKTDCLQALGQAEKEFNAGHFYGLSSLLQECLQSNGYTNEQKVRAYILLTQAYLLTDDPIAAEDSYLRLLNADPEYVADELKDPVDVYYLSKKFTATPRFTPTLLRAGANVSFARIIREVNTNSTPDSSKYKQPMKLGFQVGTGIDWNINDNISVGTELNFSLRSFETRGKDLFKHDEQLVTEKQYWFDVPVYFKYADHLGKVRPFGYFGFAINLLIADKAKLSYINRTPALKSSESGSETPTQGPDVDFKYKRNFLNQSLVFGGGIRYKIGKDFVVIDARYMSGLSNLTRKDRNFYSGAEGYEMTNTIGKYSYVGDYFRLDNLSLSIGYVKPLFDPRKIKRAKTKSAMKQISKQKGNEKK